MAWAAASCNKIMEISYSLAPVFAVYLGFFNHQDTKNTKATNPKSSLRATAGSVAIHTMVLFRKTVR
jgi:hypothetical protein